MQLAKVSLTVLAAAVALSPLVTQAVTEEEADYLRAYGWVVATEPAGLPQLELSEEEIEHFIDGIREGADGAPPPVNLREIGPKMQAFLRSKAEASQQKRMAKAKKEAQMRKAKAQEYFAKLDKQDNVKKTESGLYYEILDPGSGEKPVATDEVKVHYEGRLTNGDMFDSSLKRQQPATFGLNQVIPGWTEGLQLIGKGGKIKLYIPADLAYGNQPKPGIPPGSTLIFDVELLDINPGKHTATTPPVGVDDIKEKAEEKAEGK